MTNSAGAATNFHKFLGLDHLRTLAITLVFLFHYGRLFPHPEWTNTISKFGWTGVDLFFVLSGFLISSPLLAKMKKQEHFSLKTFFIKRFFRIIPAYLVVVAIYFLIPACRERESPAPLWKYLTFTQNLGLDLHAQGTFSHAWSLCIEEQFYLLLPFILTALVYFKAVKKGFILLTLLFIFGLAARLYAWHVFVLPFEDADEFFVYWMKWIYYPTYSRLDGLLAGILIAGLVQFRPVFIGKIQRYANWIMLFSLAVLACAYYLCLDESSYEASIFGFPLIAIGYGLLVLSAILPSCFLYKLRVAPLATIAALSYAIYLIHKIVIHITQEFLSGYGIQKNSNLAFFISIAATLLGAFILNRVVEKPFQRLRERILK